MTIISLFLLFGIGGQGAYEVRISREYGRKEKPNWLRQAKKEVNCSNFSPSSLIIIMINVQVFLLCVVLRICVAKTWASFLPACAPSIFGPRSGDALHNIIISLMYIAFIQSS